MLYVIILYQYNSQLKPIINIEEIIIMITIIIIFPVHYFVQYSVIITVLDCLQNLGTWDKLVLYIVANFFHNQFGTPKSHEL